MFVVKLNDSRNAKRMRVFEDGQIVERHLKWPLLKIVIPDCYPLSVVNRDLYLVIAVDYPQNIFKV